MKEYFLNEVQEFLRDKFRNKHLIMGSRAVLEFTNVCLKLNLV